MAASTPVDYIQTYFKFQSLTRSVGKPTYESIKAVKEELKANAASVYTNRGGGAHGYLALVISPTSYASITGTVPFIAPVHPGPLTIPAGTSVNDRAILQHNYQESVREHREYIDVLNALKKQLFQSMDKKFLTKHINKQTSTIQDAIPDVLQALYKRFAPITSRTLREAENCVRDMVYSLQDSLDDIWTAIDDLMELAEAASLDYSEDQKKAMALEILTNVPDFEKACIDWHDGIAADNSWNSFMSHFEDAHDSLAQVRGTTMAQAGYQPMANMVASQFEEIEQLRRQIQDLQSRDTIAEQAAETPAPAANHTAATNDPVQIAMLSTLATIASQLSSNGSGNDRTNSQRPRRNNDSTGERRQRRDITKYCYTHGACAHTGTDCRAKTTGHQDAATFANKMGGSTLYCRTATA